MAEREDFTLKATKKACMCVETRIHVVVNQPLFIEEKIQNKRRRYKKKKNKKEHYANRCAIISAVRVKDEGSTTEGRERVGER